jgi:hypothetical protein
VPGRRVHIGRQGVRERAEQRGAEAARISGQLTSRCSQRPGLARDAERAGH